MLTTTTTAAATKERLAEDTPQAMTRGNDNQTSVTHKIGAVTMKAEAKAYDLLPFRSAPLPIQLLGQSGKAQRNRTTSYSVDTVTKESYGYRGAAWHRASGREVPLGSDSIRNHLDFCK